MGKIVAAAKVKGLWVPAVVEISMTKAEPSR